MFDLDHLQSPPQANPSRLKHIQRHKPVYPKAGFKIGQTYLKCYHVPVEARGDSKIGLFGVPQSKGIRKSQSGRTLLMRRE